MPQLLISVSGDVSPSTLKFFPSEDQVSVARKALSDGHRLLGRDRHSGIFYSLAESKTDPGALFVTPEIVLTSEEYAQLVVGIEGELTYQKVLQAMLTRKPEETTKPASGATPPGRSPVPHQRPRRRSVSM